MLATNGADFPTSFGNFATHRASFATHWGNLATNGADFATLGASLATHWGTLATDGANNTTPYFLIFSQCLMDFVEGLIKNFIMNITEIRKNIKNIRRDKINCFLEQNSASIFDYQDFIKVFPYKKQSFHIERNKWCKKLQNTIANRRCLVRFFSIYGDRDMIRFNREQVFEETPSMKEFILKVLMWGYSDPNKARGNIEKLLEIENFENLKNILEKYKNHNISTEQLRKDISEIKGLGISTMSKFLYFLNAKIDGFKALILDDQIIKVFEQKRLKELTDLKISRYNAVQKYSQYLGKIEKLSKELDCEPDQIEISPLKLNI